MSRPRRLRPRPAFPAKRTSEAIMLQELTLSEPARRELAALYEEMERRYDDVARKLGHGCADCPDNCCDSYFLHYTYLEWAYLWEGLRTLSPEVMARVEARARDHVTRSRTMLAMGERPEIMCPLNDQGRCLLYAYRLMICRLHGVPSVLTRPDGKKMDFPGCFLCQERLGEAEPAAILDRTDLLARLAEMEQRFLGQRRHLYPKVRKTIAEMIALGPPTLPAVCGREP